MNYRDARVSRKHKSISQRFADEFTATALHNYVFEAVGQDTPLKDLVTAAVKADRAANSYAEATEDSGYTYEIEQTYHTLENALEARAEEVTAQACAEVLENASDWLAEEDNPWTPEEITDARVEASGWLEDHTEAGVRAGALPDNHEPKGQA